MSILPSDSSYKTFCDLTTGYRMFRVISEAVNSGIIDILDDCSHSVDELLTAAGLQAEAGGRFISILLNTGLLEEYDSRIFLSNFSRKFLGRSSSVSQRNVLEFEPLLMENWSRLGQVLQEGQGSLIRKQPQKEYQQRLQLFQRAMGEAAAVRSRELWDSLPLLPEEGVIIDIGAGDGIYLREFLARNTGWHGVACDLPDVCERISAVDIPGNMSIYPCNILDRQELEGMIKRYQGSAGLLLFSNILHCYSEEENGSLLCSAAEMLKTEGLLVVHDFLRDANSMGAIYDLHMLVNTYNGRTYSSAETAGLLQDAGFPQQLLIELPSGSMAMIAHRTPPYSATSSLFTLKKHALANGFFAAVELDPAVISSEAWVRAKCAYGCTEFGRRWSCPPHSLDREGFAELLREYSRALLIAGEPPLRGFQEQLLALEKEAFLAGFKKALVFSGGPCCWCEACPPERCSHPEKRRPSLESCGCDVFALAKRCGIPVAPLRNSDDFVQYIGLLLVD